MKKLFLTLFLSSALAGNLVAAQIVDFSTLNGTSDTAFGTQSSISLSTPLIDSDDFGTAPTSPTVYGGTNESRHVFFDRGLGAGGADVTILEIGPSSSRNYTAAYIWQKSNFLNGGDSQQVNIDSGTDFSVTWTHRTSSSSPTGHWVILQDGTIYVSNDSFVSSVADELETSISGDFTSMTWSTVDLTTSLTADPVASAAPDFTDIDGVGVYFTSDFASGGENSNARGMQLQDFTASTTVIPEPSAAALLLGVGGLLLIIRRRRS